MYHVWTIASNYPNLYWLKYDRGNNPDYLQFLESEKLNINGEIRFDLDKKASIDRFKKFDYIKSDAVSLVSHKLANIIKKMAGSDVQLILSKVYQQEKIIGEYYIPNVLNILDCINHEDSVFDEYGDYTKLVFKPNSLKQHKIVKVEELGDWNFIVQDELVEICKKSKINGIEFCREPYYNPLYS